MGHDWLSRAFAEPGAVRGGERLVLLALADRADRDGRCWPSLGDLARRAGLDRRQTQRCLRDLERRGLVTVTQRGGGRGRATVYQLAIAPLETATRATPFTPPKGDTGDTVSGHERATFPAERATFSTRKGVVGDAPTIKNPQGNHPPLPPAAAPTANLADGLGGEIAGGENGNGVAAELLAHRFRDGGRLAPATAARLAGEHSAELLRLALREADAGRWPAGAFANTLRDPDAVAAMRGQLADEQRAVATRAAARARRVAVAAYDAAFLAWRDRRAAWLRAQWDSLTVADRAAVEKAVNARLPRVVREAMRGEPPTCRLGDWALAEVLAERGVVFPEPEPRLEPEPVA